MGHFIAAAFPSSESLRNGSREPIPNLIDKFDVKKQIVLLQRLPPYHYYDMEVRSRSFFSASSCLIRASMSALPCSACSALRMPKAMDDS